MIDWILQTHFDSLAELIRCVRDRSAAVRVEAEMDGLLLAGDESVALANQALIEPQSEESVAAATLVAFELQVTALYDQVLKLLSGDDIELQAGARTGLRLCNVKSVIPDLLNLVKDALPISRIAILDVLSFHRIPAAFDAGKLKCVKDPEARRLLLECLGRMKKTDLVTTFSQETDPKIKKAFWIAMARSGHPEILDFCQRSCLQEQPCHDAIRFLGVIGSAPDIALLRRLVLNAVTAVPTIEALGALGATETIPDIIAALENPATSQAAATALERISGRSTPRADPPDPPEHLTEDELDFWFHPGEPIPQVAQQWWKQNHYYFETGKRYQAGRCVSDDPLGPAFDELPDEIRVDVYLRERALRPTQTPDWELETWPQFQRNPGWAMEGKRITIPLR